jgi:hypothetical protein
MPVGMITRKQLSFLEMADGKVVQSVPMTAMVFDHHDSIESPDHASPQNSHIRMNGNSATHLGHSWREVKEWEDGYRKGTN